jgi:hypothetical protein
MKINLPISALSSIIEEYKKTILENNQEISIKDLSISVPTPDGNANVGKFIKKFNLPILKVSLENGYTFKAATNHIVRKNNSDIYLKNVAIGDKLDHKNGNFKVTNIEESGYADCYDFEIPSPHLYYDANGLVHHNTITTATLAKICEKYGRTVTIVPNKSLVEQTEEDFVNCGLDVGVYYGDRKDIGKTHTICTWQSLNILDKKSKNDDEILSLAEFLDGMSTVMVDECFDGDTLITTPTGKKCIKDLKPGDKVINLCETTKQYKEDTVVKLHKNLANSSTEKMLELDFDTGIKIRVTANHKFLTNKGWVRADELTEGLEIIDINTYS